MGIRDRITDFRRVPASELIPNPLNWRRHPGSQQNALRGVLDDIGFADAVIARETAAGLEVLDGHLRTDVMGDDPVPVLVLDVTEEESKRLLATIDPLASMAEMDPTALMGLLDQIESTNSDVGVLLDTLAEDAAARLAADGLLDNGPGDLTEPPEPQIDRADELRKIWGTEQGQIWKIGRHRLMVGDNHSMDKLMNGSSIDFMFTSPPYNVDVAYGEESSDITKTWREYSALLKPVISGVYNHLLPGRYIGWNIGTSPKTYFIEQMSLMEELGFTYQRLLVWQKVGVPLPSWYHTVNNPVARQFSPNYTHEIVGLFSKGEPNKGQRVSFDETLQHDVFRVHQSQAIRDLDSSNGGRTGANFHLETRSRKTHPAPFPVALPRAFIQHLADMQTIVYDPFIGSGTTMVAAEQLNRVCYGMEIEPKYVAVTLERMSAMGLKPELMQA